MIIWIVWRIRSGRGRHHHHLNVLVDAVLHLLDIVMQVLDDLRAGFVDVKVLQLAPELVQVDTTARGNFAGKFGF